ncbi:MAG: hypothetical protein AABM64_09185 [Pseudomonadota bacterium]
MDFLSVFYTGGDPNLAASFRCGGNIETRENVCLDLVTKFQKETRNALDNQGSCKSRGGDDDDDDD